MLMLSPLSPLDALRQSEYSQVYFSLTDGRTAFISGGGRSEDRVFLQVVDEGGKTETVGYSQDATLYCNVY